MSPLIALACCVARAAEPAPSARWEQPAPADALLWASGSGVHVRSAPASDAQVLGDLPLGAAVQVIAEAPETFALGGRTAHWVQVRAGALTGYVWGGALTAARTDRDLDGDGDRDLATLSWRADRHLVLRAAPADTSAVVELDLGPFGDIDGPLEEASLGWTSAEQTGVPLVKIFVPGREMCGSGTWTRYVRWDGTRLSEVLREDTWADAPVWSADTLTFDPAKRRVTVVHSVSDDGEIEHSTTTVRAWDGAAFVAVGPATEATKKVQQ